MYMYLCPISLCNQTLMSTMQNSVPGTYNFNSCSNIIFNPQYGPICTSNTYTHNTELKCNIINVFMFDTAWSIIIHYVVTRAIGCQKDGFRRVDSKCPRHFSRILHSGT